MGPPFPTSEYERRWALVADEVRARGLDALVVTDKLHVEYMTGTWGSQFWATPLIVPDRGSPVFVVRRYDEDRVRAESAVQQIVTYFDRDDVAEAWADAMIGAGLAAADVGLELDGADLSPRDVSSLRALVPRCSFVDISEVLPRIMAVKSRPELEAMRTAMGFTTIAMHTFFQGLTPGAREHELAARVRRAALEAGSQDLTLWMLFGERSALPHGQPGDAVLAAGDVAFMEARGMWMGYCATLVRTAVLGDDAEASRVYSVARAGLEAALEALVPGATTGDVDAACRRTVERAGLSEAFRHRTGYSIGLRANGRRNIGLRPGGTEAIEAGMTFHLPIHLFVPGRFCVGCSETIVVTDHGAQPLAQLPRDLHVVSA